MRQLLIDPIDFGRMRADPMSTLFEGYRQLAAAFVRGKVRRGSPIALDEVLNRLPLEDLTGHHLDAIIAAGLNAGLQLHRFKRTAGLARVTRVIGMLRNLGPASVLDVGSGRGVSLWPLMDTFTDLRVTSIDRLEHRVEAILTVRQGGLSRLEAALMDTTQLDYSDANFDGVLVLEVLEHIPDVEQAIREIVRVARRFVIVSVPSKADSNPEHIHLLDRSRLERSFRVAGATRVHFENLPGHLIALAILGNPLRGRRP